MQRQYPGETPVVVGGSDHSNNQTAHQQGYTVISPAPSDVWQEVLQADASAMVFQTPEWVDALCATGQYEDATRAYETAEGKRLILPLVRRKTILPSLATQASLPDGWGMGGILADEPLSTKDVDMVIQDLRPRKLLQTVLRPNPLLAQAWETPLTQALPASPRISHVLDLDGGFDRIWNEVFSSSTRNKLRKSEHTGLEIERDVTGERIATFYEIYMNWVERRAHERHLPVWLARWTGKKREPYQKYRLAAEKLKDACQVWVASLDGEPVAASILLIFRQNAIYWRSASIRELATPTRANDLLQLRMIQEACQAGCRYYHMGESGGVESLMHFKERFGAVGKPYSVYSIERLPISQTKQRLGKVMKAIEGRLLRDSE